MWQQAEVDEWLWAIRQWKPPSLAAAAARAKPDMMASILPTPSDGPLVVDIGANVGWFAANAAAAGARVAAFEGGAA